MSWFKVSDKEGERIRNFVIYKIWATDKEMEEMFPAFMVVFVVILVVGAYFYFR
jgi:hypothetical protein